MKTTKKRKAAPRKRKSTRKGTRTVKRKRTAPGKKTAKRRTAKRKPRKTAKRKKAKRKRSTGSLNGPENTFRLSSLQRRFLSKPLQAAIIERQRRLGKTIIA